MIEGMIYAVKQANVDVVNMSIGGLPALNDGNNTRAILYNRLIAQSKAQMVFSAGNDGPGINTVGDPAVAGDVLGVGAYVHKDTWLANYGAVAAKTDGLFVFSSRGPRRGRRLQAPDRRTGCGRLDASPMWHAGRPGRRHVPAAAGLRDAAGHVDGVAAGRRRDGAARQRRQAGGRAVQARPAAPGDRVERALSSPRTARTSRATGLVDVGGAWNLLRTNIKTSRSPARRRSARSSAQFLATPNSGAGIYTREKLRPGTSDVKTVVLTRTTGSGKPVTFNLSWTGNDGTFATQPSVVLPLNQPVAVNVQVVPARPGVHSAILKVDDPSTTGIDYEVLNTVVAVADFTRRRQLRPHLPGLG